LSWLELSRALHQQESYPSATTRGGGIITYIPPVIHTVPTLHHARELAVIKLKIRSRPATDYHRRHHPVSVTWLLHSLVTNALFHRRRLNTLLPPIEETALYAG
jgi:hypothetical protein